MSHPKDPVEYLPVPTGTGRTLLISQASPIEKETCVPDRSIDVDPTTKECLTRTTLWNIYQSPQEQAGHSS